MGADGAEALEIPRGLAPEIPHGHLMTGFEDVRGHGPTHVPGSNEADVHDHVFFDLRAGVTGQLLWYQTVPSFTWLPFFRMRSLHFGHVPMR